MGKTSERTNVTVSIRDLLLYLCSRWRVLLICLLVGAVLGGAYSGYKSLKTGHSSGDEQKNAAVYENLPDNEKAAAQAGATSIIHYLNQLDYYASYDEKSLFQKLDPETARVGVLNYYIDSTDKNTSFDSLIKVYESSLIDSRFVDDVAAEFGIPKEEAYYYYDGIVRIGDDTNNNNSQTGEVRDSALIIRVYGENDEFVDKMIGIVKRSVDRISSTLPGSAVKYTVTLISESVKQNTGTFIFDRQDKNVTSRKQIIKSCNELKDSLDENVLKAVEYLVSEQYEGNYAELVFPNFDESDNGGSSFHISKKWVLAGAAGLLIIAAIVIIIKYLVKGVVRCYDDIEYTYGIQVLGTYDDPKTASKEHKTRLDKWLKSLRIKRKIQDRDSSIALIAKKLQLLAKKNDVQNICVAMGPDVDTDETFMNEVAEKADGINVTVASNILRNADAITKMLEADGVVLLEQMDRSRFSSIDQERIMCAGNNIKILGAIVAE